jgi:hypothetical protein
MSLVIKLSSPEEEPGAEGKAHQLERGRDERHALNGIQHSIGHVQHSQRTCSTAAAAAAVAVAVLWQQQ